MLRQLAVLALLFGAAAAPAHAAAPLLPGSTTLLSGPSGDTPLPAGVGDALGARQGISQTGRYVAFVSSGEAYAGRIGDPNVSHVLVRDTQTGQTVVADRAGGADGALGNDDADTPAITADGSAVAFVSQATNLGAPVIPGGGVHVFVRRLPWSTASPDTTVVVDRAQDPAPGTPGAISSGGGTAPTPAITSGHHLLVSFLARSGDLTGSSADQFQVVVRDVTTGSTFLGSHKDGFSSVSPSSSAFEQTISPDGQYVFFTTLASDVTAVQPVNSLHSQLYRAGLLTSTTDAVTDVNGDVHDPSSSADGSIVAYDTDATTAVPHDANGFNDVLVTKVGGATIAADRTSESDQTPSQGTQVPALSADGNVVAFIGGGGGSASLRTGLQTGTPALQTLSQTHEGADFPDALIGYVALAGDGSVATVTTSVVPGVHSDGDVRTVFAIRPSDQRITVASRPTGTGDYAPDTGNAAIDAGNAVSADGGVVAFRSDADGLDVAGAGHVDQLYVREVRTGVVSLASRADGPGGAAGNASAESFALSADGRHLAWISAATNLIAGGTGGGKHAYLRDLTTGVTRLVDRLPDGSIASGTDALALDADAGRLALLSTAALAGSTPPAAEVFVRDVATGTTTLASRADGPSGAVGPHDVAQLALSGDGNRVLFTESDLAGAPAGVAEAYVRDLRTHHTLLVSRRSGPTGTAAAGDAYGAALDDDGGVATFLTAASGLSPDGAIHVFARDLGSGATTLVDRATGAAGALATAYPAGAQLSGDGTRVAFLARQDLQPGQAADHIGVFVRDLSTATTFWASRTDGAAGVAFNTPDIDDGAALSASGECVLFTTHASNVVPDLPGEQFQKLFNRTLPGGTCAPSAPTGPTGPTGLTGPTDPTGPTGTSSPGGTTAPGGTSAPGGPSTATTLLITTPAGDTTPPPGPAGPDLTPPLDPGAPVLTAVRLTPSRFAVAKATTPVVAVAASLHPKTAPPSGSTLSFVLSAPANVRSVVLRERPGRRRMGKGCVASAATPKRHGTHEAKGRRCTVAKASGTLSRSVMSAGAKTVPFSGRIGSRRLKPGRYALSVQATDAAGRRSAVATVAFTVVG